MGIVRLKVPIYIPKWLLPGLQSLKRNLSPKPEGYIDLAGDRDIEWSFVAGNIPCGPGRALDFGCDGTYLSLIAARRGFETMALDLEPSGLRWQHPRAKFVQGDLLDIALDDGIFDLVINCSSVEHVGLVGRFSVEQSRLDGDLEAMARLRALMKPGAIQLLTIPIGRDHVFSPWHRVYGEIRLPGLLQGYEVLTTEFWQKNRDKTWKQCDRETATSLQAAWETNCQTYAIGCFVLRRSENTGLAR